ncbi:MAG TPA: flagellar protein FliS [Acidocella sp.]|nr:flagellar protein FliS [Acidocella sp.]
MSNSTTYRSSMFDGPAAVDWLAPGWRALRLYGRRARQAIEAGDIETKAQMIMRAQTLLNTMSGIAQSGDSAKLGGALQTIYSALLFCLLRANAQNDLAALEDFDRALAQLDRDLRGTPAQDAA